MPVTDWSDIKANVSISDVLRKYGFFVPDHGKYTILCPFHIERTASMHVDLQKGLFHCFGCSVSGSVIDLTARFEKISPHQAAEKLVGEYQIEPSSYFKIDARSTSFRVTGYRGEIKPRLDSIPYDLVELPSGYRNLSKKSIDHFSLSLTDYGVFIPHFDLTGQIVGYSIRQPDGIKPKYLNSARFPRGIPYGAYQNKEEIIKSGFAIVVEGQFDAVTLWDRGYRNVVSIMGSHMQEQQAHLLLSLTTQLILLFDGDKAGRIGAANTNRRWGRCFSVQVELLPNGIDPADWCLQNDLGASRFRSKDISGKILA